MLILSRRPHESILIGGTIRVTLVAIRRAYGPRHGLVADIHITKPDDYKYMSLAIGDTSKITDDVRLVVYDINRGQARLGIEAPVSIPVHREEVQERIDRGEPKRRQA